MAKRGLKALILVVSMLGLTACSYSDYNTGNGYSFKYTDMQTVYKADDVLVVDGVKTNKTQNDQLLSSLLATDTYNDVLRCVTKAREEAFCQNIDFAYNTAHLNWYSRYLYAFNLGIIDVNGVPTGRIDDIRYTLAAHTKEEVQSQLAQAQSAEEFATLLQQMYFITEGPSTDSEYPDILYYIFTDETGTSYGFPNEESVLSASTTDLQTWFSKFADIELNNLSQTTNKIVLTAEELEEIATDLLKTNYQTPITDENIKESSSTHEKLIDLDYLDSIKDKEGFATVTIYGQPIELYVEKHKELHWDDISIEHVLFNAQDVYENDAEPQSGYRVSLVVNNKDVSCELHYDTESKLHLTNKTALFDLFVLTEVADEATDVAIETGDTELAEDDLSSLSQDLDNGEINAIVMETRDEEWMGNSHSADMMYGTEDY